MRIYLNCPMLKNNGQKDISVCLYLCKRSHIIKCTEYTKVYPQLLGFEVDAKLEEKYGAPEIPVPLAFRKRRKRRTKAEMERDRAAGV